ncbi:MAG TPA: cupin domain-containing protein [Gammaproteobacteria bacterium]|nr:cupin domain-containing protein [Gammaproteobacteria bacterium]
MPKLDLDSIPRHTGSSYPAPFHEPCAPRIRQGLGDAGGLTGFGVNRLELEPGAWSSQRHWHSAEDEFVYVLSGELVLVTDAGEQTLRAGDCAAFPKGEPNGHHLINKSRETAVCLEVGGRSSEDICTYSDIDMRIDSRDEIYTHRDGTPYPPRS